MNPGLKFWMFPLQPFFGIEVFTFVAEDHFVFLNLYFVIVQTLSTVFAVMSIMIVLIILDEPE